MVAKIFYRELELDTEMFEQPRFQLVGVAGVDIKLYGSTLSMNELKKIASGVGADLECVYKGPKHVKPEELVEVS